MIQRLFTLLTLLSLQLFAHQYDDYLLSIEAKLFPKITMLENSIIKKNTTNVSIVIFYEEIDTLIAKKLQSRILKNYPDGLLSKKIKVTIAQTLQEIAIDTDCIIVLYHEEERVIKLASWANQHHILTFSYDASYLEYGILGSIYLGKSTKPYLNAAVIRDYSFIFDTYLLQLSKIKL